METIHCNGTKLQCWAFGQGLPLVMLHGLGNGNMATWFSGFASPLSQERRVILYDLRGHGGSEPVAKGYDLDTQAEDLQTVVRHFGLESTPVDVVGHSMGALIALRYALRWPGSVGRLVLVDAPMPACDYVAPSLKDGGSAAPVSSWLDGAAGKLACAGRGERRKAQRLASLLLETSLTHDVAGMTSEADADLARLHLPVWLIYGRRSPCRDAGEHLHGVLPAARLEWLDCGHYVPEEAPGPLLALLREILLGAPIRPPAIAAAAGA